MLLIIAGAHSHLSTMHIVPITLSSILLPVGSPKYLYLSVNPATLPWLYLTLLHPTMVLWDFTALYHGSHRWVFKVLVSLNEPGQSTTALLDSIAPYHSSTWLYHCAMKLYCTLPRLSPVGSSKFLYLSMNLASRDWVWAPMGREKSRNDLGLVRSRVCGYMKQ